MNTTGVFLTIASFLFLYPGLFLSAWSFKVEHKTTGTLLDISMSSLDLILSFWNPSKISLNSGIAGLMFCIFSVVLPHLKLMLIVYSMYSDAPIVLGGQYINIKRLVRAFGKYQLIDMYFVTILAAALPNAFIDFNLEPGFYCFFIYCMLSSLGAILVDWVPYTVEIEAPDTEDKQVLTAGTGIVFGAFVFWALFMPVMKVAYEFDNYLYVAGVQLSLLDILRELSAESHSYLAGFCFFSLVALPLFRVAVVVRDLWVGGEHRGSFTDMIHLDVFGVSLVAVYFVINSMAFIFPALKIVGPEIRVTWGFFCLLMAAITFNEITSRVAPPIFSDRRDERLDNLAQHPDDDDEDAILTGVAKSFSKPLVLVKAGICGLFFVLWAMSRFMPTPVTIHGIQEVFRKNLWFFTQRLQGMMRHLNKYDKLTRGGRPLYHVCVGMKGAIPCHEKGSKIVEVILRHVEGMNGAEIKDITLTASKGLVTMNVTAFFKKLSLSIFIGLCANPTAIRGVFTGFAMKDTPSCGLINLFDKDHTYHNVSVTISITAPCHREYPFVKAINASDFVIHTPMAFELPLRTHRLADFGGFPSRIDKNEGVKAGMKMVAQSWIDADVPWLPLGDVMFTVTQLVNHVASMNTPDDSGVFEQCLP